MSVVKNAACGNNSALAKAVLKDQELKDLILMEITNEIKKGNQVIFQGLCMPIKAEKSSRHQKILK